MKKSLILICLILFSTFCVAQEIEETIIPPSDSIIDPQQIEEKASIIRIEKKLESKPSLEQIESNFAALDKRISEMQNTQSLLFLIIILINDLALIAVFFFYFNKMLSD